MLGDGHIYVYDYTVYLLIYTKLKISPNGLFLCLEWIICICYMNRIYIMSYTKIITLNVKGINNVVKSRKIHSMPKKDKVQVALLQETHPTDLENLK